LLWTTTDPHRRRDPDRGDERGLSPGQVCRGTTHLVLKRRNEIARSGYGDHDDDSEDDDDEDSEDDDAAVETTVESKDVAVAYVYGGRLVGKDSVVEPGDSALQPSRRTTKGEAAYAIAAAPRAALLGGLAASVYPDQARTLLVPRDAAGEEDAETAASTSRRRAGAVMRAVGGALRRQDLALVCLLKARTAKGARVGQTRLCAIAPRQQPRPSSSPATTTTTTSKKRPRENDDDDDADDEWDLRVLPWGDQWHRAPSPLQALFAADTTQGAARRRTFLSTTTEPQHPDDALRSAADAVVAARSFAADASEAAALASRCVDSHRHRVWDAAILRAAPSGEPPTLRDDDDDEDDDDPVPRAPASAVPDAWRAAVDKSSAAGAAIEAWTRATDAVLRAARAERDRRREEQTFSMRGFLAEKGRRDDTGIATDAPPMPYGASGTTDGSTKDEEIPRLSTTHPVPDFLGLFEAALARGDGAPAACAAARQALAEIVAEFLALARDEDDDIYFDRAADTLRTLREACDPSDPRARTAPPGCFDRGIADAQFDNFLRTVLDHQGVCDPRFAAALADFGLGVDSKTLYFRDDDDDDPTTTAADPPPP